MANMRVAISAPPSVALPDCTPNLMPFHIDYSGPAAVKTFMRVERLFEKRETTEGTKQPEEETIPETIPLASTSEMPISELSMTRSATESTLAGEPSQASLSEAASTLTALSQTRLASPPIDDAEKRFVSTFRGRSVHGLTVDLPEGYVGVVLRTTANQEGEVKKSEDKTGTEHSRNEERQVGMKLRAPRRRGRLTSSAVPRKGTVLTISDDNNDKALSTDESCSFLEENHGVDMVDSPLPIPEHDNTQPIRVLSPTERFNSFTLWQADRMVDKSHDEYWRTLTEWIGLAHESKCFPLMSAKRASLGGHRQGLCLQMHRISNDPTCSDLPALCSELDHGGGVFINSTFMVYTLTSYPPFLTHAMSDPPHPLKVAASRIASHIPFVFHLSSTDKITSLPIPGNVKLEIHRIPYFFANAATCTRGLCVAGRNHSVVETLLAVLGRPWCVIEFCCGGSDEAVSALSEFAQAARDICPSSAYTAAVLLFQHELATRQANRGGGMYETRNNTARSAKWLEVCKTVFDISSNSYNGFWLRLVCCVAVGMGLQYSVVGQMLDGVDLRDRWRSLRLAPPLATRSILGVSERRLSRSRSLVHFHNDVRKKVLCPSLSTDRVETNAVFFMRVYSYLLRVLLETNV